MTHDPKWWPSLLIWASLSESDATFLLDVATAGDTSEGKGSESDFGPSQDITKVGGESTTPPEAKRRLVGLHESESERCRKQEC